ncbi:MAG: response regulator [Actinomycetota bacterium]
MRAGFGDTEPRDGVTIRVVVVDDHQLVRDGLRAVLSQEPDIEVVDEAEGVAEAVRRVAYTEPDVVTLDVDLPDGSGVDACAPIKTVSPHTRILIVTAYADPGLFRRAQEKGADGYVLKRTGDFRLVEQIRRVAGGDTAFDDHPPPAGSPDPALSRLTEREISILELIADGRTNREIADELFLAEKTVKNYVSNMLSKMGVRHRSAAAAHLVRQRTAAQRGFPPSDWENAS